MTETTPGRSAPDPMTLEMVRLQLDRWDLAEAKWILAREIGRIQMLEHGGQWETASRGILFEDLDAVELYEGRDKGQDALGVLCRAHWLALIGARVMDLDGEDFDDVDDWRGVPKAIRTGLGDAAWPERLRAPRQGALNSLVPLMRLILELIDIRAERDEISQILAHVHLVADYLPLLAWETVLGDGGSPTSVHRRLSASRAEWDASDSRCPRHKDVYYLTLKSGNARHHDDEFRSYIHNQQRTSSVLEYCASSDGSMPRRAQGCPNPCSVAPASSGDTDLMYRVAIGRLLSSSHILKARHESPMGHFFAVPDDEEVGKAWMTSRSDIINQAKHWPMIDKLRVRSPGTLVGLGSLIGAVAGLDEPLEPSTLMGDLRDHLRDLLDEADSYSILP